MALAALVGLGVIREGHPWALSVGAVGVVLLPCLGLAGLARFRPAALTVSLWLWPGLVLVGLPLYFPGERADALSTGLSWMGAAWGQQTAERAAALGETLTALLGPESLAGTPPAPRVEAEPLRADPTPRPEPARATSARALSEDQVILPYEGAGRSLRVPVSFEGAGGDAEEFWMLFDTGATFTTLDEATLRALGQRIPRDAPEVTLQTAGGTRQARLVLIRRLWLGGFPVNGVTVAVCEPCAEGGVSGLLGLNVSGQFQVTLDHEHQEMTLKPGSGPVDRHLDISEWLKIETHLAAWPDGRMELEVVGQNRSDRAIRGAVVGIQCPEERFPVNLDAIPAGSDVERRVSLPRNTNCPEYRVTLDRALW